MNIYSKFKITTLQQIKGIWKVTQLSVVFFFLTQSKKLND